MPTIEIDGKDQEHFYWLVAVFVYFFKIELSAAQKLAAIAIEYEKPNRGIWAGG